MVESDGQLLGCGGWSYRRTLFGGDARAERDAGTLDPGTDAAKIRAFFVDPAAARRGVGSAILERCEEEARRQRLSARGNDGDAPGKRLYEARGYVPEERVQYPVGPGVMIEFVPMSKSLTR